MMKNPDGGPRELEDGAGLCSHKRQNSARVIPLFTLDAQQKLRVLTSQDAYEDSSNGERLIALVWKTDKGGEIDSTAS